MFKSLSNGGFLPLYLSDINPQWWQFLASCKVLHPISQFFPIPWRSKVHSHNIALFWECSKKSQVLSTRFAYVCGEETLDRWTRRQPTCQGKVTVCDVDHRTSIYRVTVTTQDVNLRQLINKMSQAAASILLPQLWKYGTLLPVKEVIQMTDLYSYCPPLLQPIVQLISPRAHSLTFHLELYSIRSHGF